MSKDEGYLVAGVTLGMKIAAVKAYNRVSSRCTPVAIVDAIAAALAVQKIHTPPKDRPTYEIGDSWTEPDADKTTYTIDCPDENHKAKIHVYGDEPLRNHICHLLNNYPVGAYVATVPVELPPAGRDAARLMAADFGWSTQDGDFDNLIYSLWENIIKALGGGEIPLMLAEDYAFKPTVMQIRQILVNAGYLTEGASENVVSAVERACIAANMKNNMDLSGEIWEWLCKIGVLDYSTTYHNSAILDTIKDLVNEDRKPAPVAMTSHGWAAPAESVDHPAHYGGEDNPYEVIKVMEEWLSYDEFVGAMKFNIHKYLARAPFKGIAQVDYEKGMWYTQRLVDYIKRKANAETNSA